MTDKPNTAAPRKPRGRWFQFRLRTLLIVVTITAVLFPLGAQYVRDRQARKQREREERHARLQEEIRKLERYKDQHKWEAIQEIIGDKLRVAADQEKDAAHRQNPGEARK